MADPDLHPRKRRRRREAAQAVAAKFVLDDRIKGEIGRVSHDIYARFFGEITDSHQENLRYVALTSWRSIIPGLYGSLPWTILAVVPEDESQTISNQVRFPTSAYSLQNLAKTFEGTRLDARARAGVDVLVLDTHPLTLDTVFVKLDGDALRKHEEVQKRFGGGFHGIETNGRPKISSRTNSTKANESKDDLSPDSAALDVEERLKSAVRTSLKQLPVIHSNELLPLPLPSHPITHAPFPPILVMLAEPVAQGQITSNTEVVIEIDFKNSDIKYKTSTLSRTNGASRLSAMISAMEDEGDTTDQFYSAAENDDDEIEADREDEDVSANETDSDDADDLSDDSDENVISLNSPTLPPQASGILSARTAATPRPFGLRMNGITSPGAASIYSNYTARTISQQTFTGKSFSARALAAKVPEDTLHPRPAPDEDDEARVFVDVKVLVRLGCFSGDWVKLSAIPKPGHGDQLFGVGDVENDELVEIFRPVKIYGISGAFSNETPHHSRNNHARRSSIGSLMTSMRMSPHAYISPILLANIGGPSNVAIAPLMGRQQPEKKFSSSKVSAAATPPAAIDLTLFRLLTPIASLRTTSVGIFSNLKQYFEDRRRIVKEGDLIAIKFTPTVSSILSHSGNSLEVDEDLQNLLIHPDTGASKENTDVAWFKVGKISGKYTDEMHSGIDSDVWGGAACAEPWSTKMHQAGSECIRLPSARKNPWLYYMGIKQTPTNNSIKSSNVFSQDDLTRPYISNLQRHLSELLAASTSPQAQRLKTQPLSLLIFSTQRRIGKTHLVSSACADLGLNSYEIDAYDILSEGGGGGDSKTEDSLRSKIDFAVSCGSHLTVPVIKHVEALTAERMAAAIGDALKEVRAIVFTTTEREKIPESIRSLFTHELEVMAPDEKEREGILRSVITEQNVKLSYDVELSSVALKTAALVAGDLVDVIERAMIAQQERLEKLATTQEDCLLRDIILAGGNGARSVTKPDFDVAIEAARKNFADAIGAPKIPNVTWDDVGGLTHVKDAVMETIQLPLERPELFAKGMKKRSGILFYGPPGTGKTLLAKAIATEFSLNFFSVKGPELLNMYIGESEANVRRVFQKARDARPCVVFFDELDSVAPKRGNQGDSGGVMDRIVSQLLAELDGMGDGSASNGGVFVIGATNRPDLLDQALLRPGRFDKMLYLGVSDTHDKQLTILEALTRKFTLDENLSLRRVAETLPFTYTGADLYALCSDAMLKAITRKASAVDEKIKALPNGPVSTAYFFDHYATEEDIDVVVMEEDFRAAQKELISSVSAKELEHYQRVRQTFESSSTAVTSATNGPVPIIESSSSRTLPIRSQSKVASISTNSNKGQARATYPSPQTLEQQIDIDDDDDEAYVSTLEHDGEIIYHYGNTDDSSIVKGKGKGKAPVQGAFGGLDEDEDLYSS